MFTSLFLSAALSVIVPPEAEQKMFPDGVDHDFGVVTSGVRIRHVFRLVNTTDQRRTISLRCS